MFIIFLLILIWIIFSLSSENWQRMNEVGSTTFSFFSGIIHLFKEGADAAKGLFNTGSAVTKDAYYAVTTPVRDFWVSFKDIFEFSADVRDNRQQRKIEQKQIDAELRKQVADALQLIQQGNKEGNKLIAYYISLHGEKKIKQILKELEEYGCG